MQAPARRCCHSGTGSPCQGCTSRSARARDLAAGGAAVRHPRRACRRMIGAQLQAGDGHPARPGASRVPPSCTCRGFPSRSCAAWPRPSSLPPMPSDSPGSWRRTAGKCPRVHRAPPGCACDTYEAPPATAETSRIGPLIRSWRRCRRHRPGADGCHSLSGVGQVAGWGCGATFAAVVRLDGVSKGEFCMLMQHTGKSHGIMGDM